MVVYCGLIQWQDSQSLGTGYRDTAYRLRGHDCVAYTLRFTPESQILAIGRL